MVWPGLSLFRTCYYTHIKMWLLAVASCGSNTGCRSCFQLFDKVLGVLLCLISQVALAW
jgi:hypothetical protein